MTPADASPTPRTAPPAADLSARGIADLGGDLYRDAGPLTRVMCRHRTRICPLELVAAQVPPGASALDIGCGTGLMLNALAAGGQISAGLGFDASPGAISAATAAAARLGPRGATPPAFEHRRVEQGVPEGGFDVVMLIDVMHHVHPAARRGLIADAASRVVPGGRFIYKDMVDRPRWRALANQAHDLVMARQLIRYCPVEDVEAWAGEHALTLVHSSDDSRLWYGHELRVFEKGDA